jgi:hypothetical protein
MLARDANRPRAHPLRLFRRFGIDVSHRLTRNVDFIGLACALAVLALIRTR